MGIRLPHVTTVRVFALGVAIVLGSLTLMVSLSMRRTPGPMHDYASDLNDLAHSYQPGASSQPNRWEDVLELFNKLSELRKTLEDHDSVVTFDELADRDNASMRALYESDGRIDYDEQIALAQRYVALVESEGLFDRLAELPEIRHAYPETSPGGAIWLGPPDFSETLFALGQIQEAADMLSATMVDAGRRGDLSRALDLFEQSLAVSRISSCPPQLIAGLSAIGIETLTISRMSSLVLEHRLEDGELDMVLQILDEQGSLPMRYSIEAEFLMTADMVQRVFTDDGDGDGIVAMTAMGGAGFTGTVFEPIPKHPSMNLLGTFLPGKKAVTERLGAYEQLIYDALNDHTIETPDIEEFEATRGDVVMRLPFVRQMVATKSGSVRNERIRQSHRSALRISIALARFHTDRGSYPLSLGELSPDYIGELPVDPIALGAPYRYKPPAFEGELYTLYSIGINGTDEGGEASASSFNDDRVFVKPVNDSGHSTPAR